MGVSYNKVKGITRDIPSAVQLNRIKLNKLRSEIRREVKNGKLKKQVKSLGLPVIYSRRSWSDVAPELQRKIDNQ